MGRKKIDININTILYSSDLSMGGKFFCPNLYIKPGNFHLLTDPIDIEVPDNC